MAGRGEILAHRDQLRPYKGHVDEMPNIRMTSDSDAAPVVASGSGVGEEEFRGYPDEELMMARKRKATEAKLPDVCLRRSKRLRKPTVKSNFLQN